VTASDHLNPAQFFHGSTHTFQPGDVLSPEGATMAKWGPENGARMQAMGWGEKHVHYGDESFLGEAHNLYGREGHVYAVQPQTRRGTPITRNSPDPHYRNYGGGAYRTTGQLRVLHEVDEKGRRI
jgi:hypothetical protein